ncbi:suppressor of fused domain protein [Brevibacillus sp. H7]|uniref:suppressor of fused domain protein n=1 Tax=Brevibacillus sp. H7 TaxID=3349138 RepID=UPI00381AE462
MNRNVVNQILSHCTRMFRCEGDLYQTEEADVLLAVFPATRKRGWWTYVTLELHRTGKTECAMYSYRFEPRLIPILGHAARQVQKRWEQKGLPLQSGDVIPLCGPVAKGSQLNKGLVTPAYFEEEDFACFTNGSDVVHMMMIHAIAEAEAEFLAREGLEALEAVFRLAQVDSLDFARSPAIQEGEGA